MLGAKTLNKLGVGLGIAVGFIPVASTIVLGMHYHTLASGWALAGCTIGFASLLLVSGLAYRRSRAQKQDPNIQFDGENSPYEQAERMGHNAKKCVILASAGLAACFVSGAVFGLLNPVAFSQTLSGMFLLSTGVAETALSAGQVAGLDIGFLVLAAVITVACVFLTRRKMKNATIPFPDENVTILNADDSGDLEDVELNRRHLGAYVMSQSYRRDRGPEEPRYKLIEVNGQRGIMDTHAPEGTSVVHPDTPAARQMFLGIPLNTENTEYGRGFGTL